jgi:hypothetical protein
MSLDEPHAREGGDEYDDERLDPDSPLYDPDLAAQHPAEQESEPTQTTIGSPSFDHTPPTYTIGENDEDEDENRDLLDSYLHPARAITIGDYLAWIDALYDTASELALTDDEHNLESGWWKTIRGQHHTWAYVTRWNASINSRSSLDAFDNQSRPLHRIDPPKHRFDPALETPRYVNSHSEWSMLTPVGPNQPHATYKRWVEANRYAFLSTQPLAEEHNESAENRDAEYNARLELMGITPKR